MAVMYGTFTCLVHTHMWDVHLHHIKIQNISCTSMSDAQMYFVHLLHFLYVGRLFTLHMCWNFNGL